MKIVANLIHNKSYEIFKFLFSHPSYIAKLVEHCYSRSITSLLVLLLNIRRTLRLYAQGENLEQDLEQLITSFRQEFLSQIALKAIETCDDPERLEDHLNAVMILVDAMENFDSIQNGRNIINWVLFDSNPQVMRRLCELLTDCGRRNYGQIPELLNHICATVKKIHGSTESNRPLT